MFKTFAKIFGLFILAYVIFSIPIGNKSLFQYMSEVVNPLAKKSYESLSENAKTSLGKTQKLGEKLFSNSEPRSLFKAEGSKTQAMKHDASDDIKDEERAALNKLIGN